MENLITGLVLIPGIGQRPALKTAQVKYRRPYNCRHTYASTMLTNGKDPTWLAKQMGHKDWGMIRMIYARWIDD